MYMSKFHSYYCGGLQESPPQICAALSRLNPARRTVFRRAKKRTVCPEVVELGIIATEVEYPLLRACSTSAAIIAAGKHTHVRTHRTSSDPAYL
jgi:hypothetical protein